MHIKFAESTLEEAVLDYLVPLGWQVAFGPKVATISQNFTFAWSGMTE
jgi:hypothetical protein